MNNINFIETETENLYQKDILRESLKQLEFSNVLEFISKYCLSELGKNLIINLIPNPNIEEIINEHELISEIQKLVYNDNLPQLQGLNNVRQQLYKSLIDNATLNTIEILNIYDTIRVFRTVKNYIIDKEEDYPYLFRLLSNLFDNRILEKHITEAIDDTGEVKDNATKELLRIRTEIKHKSARLRDRLLKILRRISQEEISREDFYSIREGRFVLPVKVEYKRELTGIIHGISQTGATVFIEPSEIIEMNNEISLLKNEEQREVYTILNNLTKEIGENAHNFIDSLDIMARFDSLIARAKYAIDFGGIKPKIHNEEYIYLRNIRHPLLAHTKKIKNVVPLSIEFNNEIRGHLISGPNAGGKTVALKSVGINLLMALSGIYPLGECQTNFRYIFTAIGDQQSIENDLSTFSSQILRLKNIIDYCNRNSLVLVDEIGSGTDPQEGSALACGILDTFLNIKLFFIATTHQSSLKSYALKNKEIENDSLEFDSEKLKPTYRFLNGVPGNSYAFVLAKNIGLPTNIINRAKNYLGSKQGELEESIQKLQEFKSDAQRLSIHLAEEKLKYEKLVNEYNSKLQELKIKKSDFINNAKIEADSIIKSANSLIEKTIKELKEASKPISEIKNEFVKEKEKIEKEALEIRNNNLNEGVVVKDLVVGDEVILIGTNSNGIVLEANNQNKIATVDFNGFKVKIKYNELQKVNKPKVKKENSNFIKFDIKTKLDIRGLRAEEAIRELDIFIQDAIVNGVQRLSIIHGKGTGALRQVVHNYLDNLNIELNYHLGDLVEGGAGITIVEIK